VKISPWDSLNKAAIIVTLVTGVTGILTFFGSQLLSAIILLSVALSAILFLSIRNIQYHRKIKKKDSILNEIFKISGALAAEIREARHEIFELFDRTTEDLPIRILRSLQRSMDSLAKIANLQTGGNCRASVSILTTKDDNEDILIQTVARNQDSTTRQHNDEIILPLKYLTESKVIRSGKPLIIDDLSKLVSEGQYKNVNPNWALLYRSTAVVPIQADINPNGKTYFGFLAIDSPKANAFQESIMPVLEFYADWCSLLLSQLDIERYIKSQKNSA